MGFVLIDGFDDTSSWTTVAGSPTITTTNARHGSSVQLGGTTTLSIRLLTSQESDTVTVGAAMRITPVSQNINVLRLCSDAGTTTHILVVWATTGAMSVLRGVSNTLITTATGVVPPNTWAYVELQVTLSDTVGSAQLRVNGTVVGAVTNVDTKNAGTKTVFDTVIIESINGTGGTTLMDDLYVMSGTGDAIQGDATVETLYPNGNGSVSSWLGSDSDSVNNYLLVDETGTPDTADYTSSPTAGAQDMYTLSNMTATVGTVLGVCHAVTAAKSDSGTKQFKIVNRRSADNKSEALTLSQTFGPHHYCLATDPETGVGFTIAGVNALQSGVEVV